MQTRTRIVLVAAVWCWIYGLGTTPTVAARSSHVCDELCGSGASCDAECWLSQFDYDQDYPPTSCGAEGYECCGDGWCDPSTEGCNGCPDDCGYVPNGCSVPVECTTFASCPNYPDEICNSAHQCVPWGNGGEHPPQCPGSCTTDANCCGSDKCIGDPGLKYCGTPAREFCQESPSCSSPQDCTIWSNGILCQDGYHHRPLFCNPGTNRCEYVEGPDCPDINSLCTPNI